MACLADLPKDLVRPQKPLGLGEAGDGLRPGGLVGPGNVQVGEILGDDPLRGRGLLHLAEEGEALFGQGGLEPLPASLSQGTALGLEHIQAVGLPVRRHPLAGVGGQLFQDGHAPTPSRLLPARNLSRVSMALPVSMQWAARATPSCMVSAWPPR